MHGLSSLRWSLAASFVALVLLATGLLTGIAVHTMTAITLQDQEQRSLVAVEGVETAFAGAIQKSGFSPSQVAWQQSIVAGGHVLWLDNQGNVIGDSFFNQSGYGHPYPLPSGLRQAAVPVTAFAQNRGAWLAYAVAPLRGTQGQNGEIVLVRSLQAVHHEVDTIQQYLWAIGGALALFCVIAGFWFADSLARPLERLTAAAQRVARGDLSSSVDVSGTREIAALSSVFNSMTAQLSRMDEQRRAFVADAAHELRTPLASLHTLAQTHLLQEQDPRPATARLTFQSIAQETDRLGRLVGNLLTLAQLDNPDIHLEALTLRLADLIQEATWVVSPIAKEAGVQVEVQDPGPTAWILGDPDWLERAFVNVLDNAIRYTPKGQAVVVAWQNEAPKLRLTVQDSGAGVPADLLPQLGQRFYRAERARERATGGSGLGLAIVRDIISRHGGSLAFASPPDAGLLVTICLPLAEEPADA